MNRLATALIQLSLIALCMAVSGCFISEQPPAQEQLSAATLDHKPGTTQQNALLPGSSNPLSDQSESHQLQPELLLDGTVWPVIRRGYGLTDYQHQEIDRQLNWYLKHPAYLSRAWQRAEPYLHFILQELDNRLMPTEIALLPMVESAFSPLAYSHGNAAGLWQFIPSTGRNYGLRQDWWVDQRRDIVASTRAALDYLQKLNKDFGGDWLLALAAYNAGEGRIRKELRKNQNRGIATDFVSLNLKQETRAYVPKLLALARIIKQPKKYGITLPSIKDQPYFDIFEPGEQLDLHLISDISDLSMDEIYRLNPSLNRSITPPDGPHRLLIPVESSEQLKTALARVPPENRVQWTRHQIRPGESLIRISNKYQTTVSALQQSNELSGSHIRSGDYLMIPLSLAAPKPIIQRCSKTITHVIKPGDTIWDIAMGYGSSVKSIRRCNQSTSSHRLKIGEGLQIPTTDKNTPGKPSLSAPEKRRKKLIIQVKKGDSLDTISRRFGVSLNQLKTWNQGRLKGKKYLQPGDKLTVYKNIYLKS